MKVISYKEFVNLVHNIIEAHIGSHAEGKILFNGYQLKVNCGIKNLRDVEIFIWLDYGESGFYEPHIELDVAVEYDKETNEISQLIKEVALAMDELASEFLDTYVDFDKISNFKQFEWKSESVIK